MMATSTTVRRALRRPVFCGAIVAFSSSFLLAACGSSANTPVVPVANGEVPAGHYVALGDSFSSGEGVPPFVPGTDVTLGDDCHRSTIAYPKLLEGHGSVPQMAPQEFVACSGARMDALFTTASDNQGHQKEGPQVSQLDRAVGLVTLTFGGDDVGFADLIRNCIFKFRDTCSNQDSALFEPALKAIDGTMPGNHSGLTLLDAYRRIRQAAPRARILVLGYPHEFAARGCSSIDTRDVPFANHMADRLDETIRKNAAASNAGIQFVDVRPFFSGHALCTGRSEAFNGYEKFSFFHNKEYSFHPNPLGQRLYRDAVVQALNQPAQNMVVAPASPTPVTASPPSTAALTIKTSDGFKYDVSAGPISTSVTSPDGTTSAPPGTHYLQTALTFRNDQTDRPAPNPFSQLTSINYTGIAAPAEPANNPGSPLAAGGCHTRASVPQLPPGACLFGENQIIPLIAPPKNQPDQIPAGDSATGIIYALAPDSVGTAGDTVWISNGADAKNDGIEPWGPVPHS